MVGGGGGGMAKLSRCPFSTDDAVFSIFFGAASLVPDAPFARVSFSLPSGPVPEGRTLPSVIAPPKPLHWKNLGKKPEEESHVGGRMMTYTTEATIREIPRRAMVVSGRGQRVRQGRM